MSWRFVPLSEHAVPEAIAERVRGRARRLWRVVRQRLGGAKAETEAVHLEALPEDRLAELLPEIDVEAAAGGLEEALGDGWEGARVVVGPPGSHAVPAVAALARRRGWKVLDPPADGAPASEAELEAALATLAASTPEPVVLDGLERWSVRSAAALPAARRLLEALGSAGRPVVVRSDSWTWAFLRRAAAAETRIGQPLVAAPLDAARLDAWLGAPFRAAGVACRAGDGREAFARREGERSEGGDPQPSTALRQLAGVSRGIAGVALAVWRRSLETAAPGEGAAAGADAEDGGVRVAPPGRREIELPPDLRVVDRLLLHALLLHAGLSAAALEFVLPFARHELGAAVAKLARAGVLAGDAEGYAVAPAAYPSVRRDLDAEGLLTDGL